MKIISFVIEGLWFGVLLVKALILVVSEKGGLVVLLVWVVSLFGVGNG